MNRQPEMLFSSPERSYSRIPTFSTLLRYIAQNGDEQGDEGERGQGGTGGVEGIPGIAGLTPVGGQSLRRPGGNLQVDRLVAEREDDERIGKAEGGYQRQNKIDALLAEQEK